MKIILKAFGTLTAEMEVRDLREKIYLVHLPPFDISMMISPDVSLEPVAMKAVFEWRGKYEDDKPLYEFIGLE